MAPAMPCELQTAADGDRNRGLMNELIKDPVAVGVLAFRWSLHRVHSANANLSVTWSELRMAERRMHRYQRKGEELSQFLYE